MRLGGSGGTVNPCHDVEAPTWEGSTGAEDAVLPPAVGAGDAGAASPSSSKGRDPGAVGRIGSPIAAVNAWAIALVGGLCLRISAMDPW